MGQAGTMNRGELATFLRTRRHRLRPADVGLPGGGRRRTPGLRRQEVAQLAGISVDYYIRLEQARGPHPSRQVLTALGRALMLTADEREYLFRLAGESPPPTAGPSREISPGIRNLLDSMPETPAYVVDAKYDVLAWNSLATHFIGDLSLVPDGGQEHAPLDIPAARHGAAVDRRGGGPVHPVHDRGPARLLRALPRRPRHRRTPHRTARHLAAVRADVAGARGRHQEAHRQAGRPSADRAAGVRVPGAAHPGERPAADRVLRRARLGHPGGVPPARPAGRSRPGTLTSAPRRAQRAPGAVGARPNGPSWPCG